MMILKGGAPPSPPLPAGRAAGSVAGYVVATTAGTRAGSLLAAIDRTVTGAGARLLAQDISAPLMDLSAIEARLGLVQMFHDDAGLRDQVRV